MRKFFAAFLLLGTFISASAQEVNLSGRITSLKDGTELPGVNVRIRGTNKGTVTDGTGVYTIAANSTDTIMFSFIGFKTVEQLVGQRSVLDVQLETEATELDAVVITGFQEVERKL